ncbi:hypothetical protein O0I10_008371 [Lichtheimia ornata]|uniref:Uncharacterized protein n=1 Tax=Lichtheimia ornata TaxID=688661 RepID=A0AAD7V1D4_9FUNG|nr:uncharacterized protein O0I10_008371 [Lichtheimia ornata]KAJ8655931.1 hypothetical protein O0I10_008371 [Lichtheimia ornata]
MKFIHFVSATLIVCLAGSVHACENKERASDPATEYVQDRCRWVGALRCSAPNLTSLPICQEGLVLTAAATGGPSCCCPPA